MVLSLCCFLFAVVLCSALPDPRYIRTNQHADESQISGYPGNIRRERALHMMIGAGTAFVKGFRAVRKLLKGAKRDLSVKDIREFKKPGGYGQAMSDFESVKPSYIQELPTGDGVFGKVGDRLIIYESAGKTGKPTIQIGVIQNQKLTPDRWKGSAKLTDRIIYTD